MKFNHAVKCADIRRSLPVRGAWIEIVLLLRMNPARNVAPRAGSVD